MPADDQARRERARQLLNQGAWLLEHGQAAEAIPLLNHAHQIDEDNVPVLINLGGAYIMAGKHRDAIPFLEAARDAEPENAMVWTNLGAAYLGNPVLASSEQQLRAIAAFERALQLNPAAPNVHYNLGLIFVDRGDSDLAIAAFRRAVAVNPGDRDAASWLRRLEGSRHSEERSDEEPRSR